MPFGALFQLFEMLKEFEHALFKNLFIIILMSFNQITVNSIQLRVLFVHADRLS